MRLLCHLCHIVRACPCTCRNKTAKSRAGARECQPQSVLAIPVGHWSVANQRDVGLLPCTSGPGWRCPTHLLGALVWGHPSADVSKGLCSFPSAPPFAGCGLSPHCACLTPSLSLSSGSDVPASQMGTWDKQGAVLVLMELTN